MVDENVIVQEMNVAVGKGTVHPIEEKTFVVYEIVGGSGPHVLVLRDELDLLTAASVRQSATTDLPHEAPITVPEGSRSDVHVNTTRGSLHPVTNLEELSVGTEGN